MANISCDNVISDVIVLESTGGDSEVSVGELLGPRCLEADIERVTDNTARQCGASPIERSLSMEV